MIGNLFYGAKGWMQLDDDGWKTFFGRKNEPGPSMTVKGSNPMDLAGSGDGGHFVNFIHAVRARDAKPLDGALPSGEHLLPRAARGEVRWASRKVRERQGRQQSACAQLSQAFCHPR